MRLVPLDRQRLAEHGVTLAKAGARWMLRCNKCGASWPVPTMIIPIGYHECPNGCNLPSVATEEDWKAWEWEEEPEVEEEPGPPDERARWLESYTFNVRMAREAESDEDKERFRKEADRFFDLYLGVVHNRTEIENEH